MMQRGVVGYTINTLKTEAKAGLSEFILKKKKMFII